MAGWLEAQGVRLVVLAGYMHLLTPPFLDRFPDAVVNVHPSLLPAFPGAHAVEEQLAAGVDGVGRDGAPRRRGRRQRAGARAGTRPGPRRRHAGDACTSGSGRSSTGCCPRW